MADTSLTLRSVWDIGGIFRSTYTWDHDGSMISARQLRLAFKEKQTCLDQQSPLSADMHRRKSTLRAETLLQGAASLHTGMDLR